MFLAGLSVKRPTAMLMVILMFVISGIINYFRLPVDLFPDTVQPYITIKTTCKGACPLEIETTVLKPIEEKISAVKGARNIESFAYEEVGYVVLEFDPEVNPDLAVIDVKDKLDAVSWKMPPAYEKPLINSVEINDNPVSLLVLTGNQNPETIRKIAENTIKENLLKIDDVASVLIRGGLEREIHVNLDKYRLDGLGLSVDQITEIIVSQTTDIPIGSVSGVRKEYMVNIQSGPQTLEQIRNIGIPVETEKTEKITVPLHSLAEIKYAYKESGDLSRFNRQNCISISVTKKPDANTVHVAGQIRKTVEKLNDRLPDGLSIRIVSDSSLYIKECTGKILKNLLTGLILVIIMLLLFTGGFRVTLITSFTLLTSVIISFSVIYIAGFTLNIITLISLCITAVITVTNTVVVFENIKKYIKDGIKTADASVMGVNDSGKVLSVSVLVIMAVFVPSAMVHGLAALIYRTIGIVLLTGAAISLLLSCTLVPLMTSWAFRKTNKNTELKKGIECLLEFFAKLYAETLRFAIKGKLLIIAGFITVCAFSVWYVVPKIGVEFLPEIDQGIFQITIQMPSGTSLSETDHVLSEVEKRIIDIPEVESLYGTIGGNEAGNEKNMAIVEVNLGKNRGRTTNEVISKIRPILADIPDAKFSIGKNGLGKRKNESDIRIEITGEKIDEILSIADTVVHMAGTVKGLADIDIMPKTTKPRIKLVPDRNLIEEYGITVAQMGRTASAYLSGSGTALFREDNDKYTIRVQYADKEKKTISDIENISIPVQSGIIPVKAVTNIIRENGVWRITRKNRERLVIVNMNVIEGKPATKTKELKKLTDGIILKPGYEIDYAGKMEIIEEFFGNLTVVAVLAIILVFMVLAGVFESMVKPLIVMTAIMSGFAGWLWTLFIAEQTISVIAVMSMFTLAGIVVNSAVLIISYADKLASDNRTRIDAVVEACKEKFRAIIIMSVTTVLMLVFHVLSKGSVQGTFSVSVLGGWITSVMISLFVVPVLYSIGKKKES
ncbi:MAG: efflux RND transporter permease subunit [Fibrobacter sp.]|nr:efflux RND transporter permease subunit [Fibrobacter sp.]